jgi:hypothetical protein
VDKKYHKDISKMSYEELLCLIGTTEEERARIYSILKKIPEGWDGRS